MTMRLWVTLDEEAGDALKELAESRGSVPSRTASELLTASLRGEQPGGARDTRELLSRGVGKFEPGREYIVSEAYELGGGEWGSLSRPEKMVVAKSLARLAREDSSPVALSTTRNKINYYRLKEGEPR